MARQNVKKYGLRKYRKFRICILLYPEPFYIENQFWKIGQLQYFRSYGIYFRIRITVGINCLAAVVSYQTILFA